MTVQCIACAHWSPKQSPADWPRLGVAICAARPKWEMHGARYVRECGTFKGAAPEVVASREAYEAKRGRP